MKIRIIDNLQSKSESLDLREAAEIAAFIRFNTQDVNQGEYTEQDLERLYSYATPENIQREMEHGYLILLSDEDGGIMGCATVLQSGTKAIIKTIQVGKAYRRRNYGSLLYQYCENRFIQAGLKEVEVQVTKFPSSENFYKKHGFVKTGNPTLGDLYCAMFKYL